MRSAKVEITSCQNCPFWKQGPRQTTDGFDSGNDWICSKVNKTIASFVEWHEVNKTEIPVWCPFVSKPVKKKDK